MKKFLRAFVYAFYGIGYCFSRERNCMLHALAAVAVTAAGFYYAISPMEWLVVLLNIALVISLEMLNTALEHICNYVQPRYHPAIKTIKNAAAGAVLIAAIVALISACIIFLPKIF